ncbi:hypothetical protein [Thalassospira sp. MCCC 1A01428]|uniref:hypothetical protein n=1 Tax=Thalassospira sp. MCCC 1A01428 TaxID=1470575 RepID=UPI000A1EE2A7|nr:hypothetical protein [Thalassospira sp. MCCC 1A01428]OSQ45795.1 hypothetical protein THS27_01685 [Thalassospira sp. MCCC 1A01428]
MSEQHSTAQVPELVGLFDTKESFDAAVRALTDAGFAHTDLSALSTHESIDVAGKDGQSWSDVLTAMFGEVKYEVPLVASGAIALFGGAATAALALAIGAGVGTMALTDFIDKVTSTPHTEEFAEAIREGSAALWVRLDPEDASKEAQAREIFALNNAHNVHIHTND